VVHFTHALPARSRPTHKCPIQMEEIGLSDSYYARAFMFVGRSITMYNDIIYHKGE
jgi:hypothetical protein